MCHLIHATTTTTTTFYNEHKILICNEAFQNGHTDINSINLYNPISNKA